MFVLVDYNNFYKDSLKEIKKYNLTPVTLFNLNIFDKNSTKEQLDKINEIKNKLQPKYSAIKVTIEKLDNSTKGTINHLKNNFNLVIGLGGLNKINRFFCEETKIDFLQDPHNSYFKPKIDFIHHFNSGLNQVLCKFAKDRDIGLLISLNFMQGKFYNVSKEIGRINQNLKFARKYGINTNINYIIQNPNQVKSKEELIAIMSIFNLSTEQKKESINILQKKIEENTFKSSNNYICRGVEII